MSTAIGDDGRGGGLVPPPPDTAALSHPPTLRAWRRARLAHHVRHLGPYPSAVAAGGLGTAAIGQWWPLLAVIGVLALLLAPCQWLRCRHASVNARRARLVLEHYPWRPYLLTPDAEPDASRSARDRSGAWLGVFFRPADPSDPEHTRVHGVPGPGRANSSVRALVEPRALAAELGREGTTEVWFAGDPRFGGVVSPPGGGRPMLLRARARRVPNDPTGAESAERDALAIRAGLLEYRELPKRHPVRREWEARGGRPGPARPAVDTALTRSTALRVAARLLLGPAGAAGLLLALVALWVLVADGDAPWMRVFGVGLALVSLAPTVLCLVGACSAGSGRRWPTWPGRVSGSLFAAGVLVVGLASYLD
ncbi:hypothetical protein [Streptomyces macrosporus]|uniref:Uncharacterized protein n=1 Tax=Streptomyces macrosporus TaxID=44032 RepID=A0ABP5WV97_9ACTN